MKPANPAREDGKEMSLIVTTAQAQEALDTLHRVSTEHDSMENVHDGQVARDILQLFISQRARAEAK